MVLQKLPRRFKSHVGNLIDIAEWAKRSMKVSFADSVSYDSKLSVAEQWQKTLEDSESDIADGNPRRLRLDW